MLMRSLVRTSRINFTLRWVVLLPFIFGCGKASKEKGDPGAKSEVIIYTALDQIYSEPILKDFEARTGIQVRAVYDSEAAKTVGLVNRLIAERARPRCDVFWNNEILRTIYLKREGLLEPYASPGSRDIPESFKDPEGCWTGFAARARVLVINTAMEPTANAPKSMADLAEPRWRARIGMAYPLFGSTATHCAALFALWGTPRAQTYFQSLKANELQIFDGNMAVCRAVANGEIPLGLTDSDDANSVRAEGKPIEWIQLDHDGAGALLIPNTISLIKGCPNPEPAKRLIDHLLSPGVEARLAASPSAQIPLHPGVESPAVVAGMAAGPFVKVDYAMAEQELQPAAELLKTLFTKP